MKNNELFLLFTKQGLQSTQLQSCKINANVRKKRKRNRCSDALKQAEKVSVYTKKVRKNTLCMIYRNMLIADTENCIPHVCLLMRSVFLKERVRATAHKYIGIPIAHTCQF